MFFSRPLPPSPSKPSSKSPTKPRPPPPLVPSPLSQPIPASADRDRPNGPTPTLSGLPPELKRHIVWMCHEIDLDVMDGRECEPIRLPISDAEGGKGKDKGKGKEKEEEEEWVDEEEEEEEEEAEDGDGDGVEEDGRGEVQKMKGWSTLRRLSACSWEWNEMAREWLWEVRSSRSPAFLYLERSSLFGSDT
ncbi:hypothetical protein BT69DRAFT_926458 [Atractiella rhizophila]|nr:hypothetical protein BT69DRAFT_926458 [Atractiella rhizophila]